MSASGSVLVVGASAAGLATVEALRRGGHRGRVTVLGAEHASPYDRPPLSKQILSGTWQPERSRLRDDGELAGLDAEFTLGDPAVGLDVAARTVRTASGRTLRADTVVVATGLEPRTFPGQAGLKGVHVLRTLDDALALRSALLAASCGVVVVGDGVLGAEIAATARTMGLPVTLVGPQPAPLAGQFGPLVAGSLADLHTANGVGLRLGTPVTGLTAHREHVTGVRTAGGEVLPAGMVVVAMGAVPTTGWLAGSGLTLDDGLVCDARCRAAPGVYAVGDVARWHHEGIGRSLRLENRSNATEQALAVAADILGDGRPYTPVPYAWTDQFDVKVQSHGFLGGDADVAVVEGDPAQVRFVALYGRGGVVTGVLGWNMPKQVRSYRRHVVSATPWHAFGPAGRQAG
ncbi:NAD(P)/FAD-dependent oxidoreductase [Streptomyces cavernicola]|uniref:FAD/NAD(P)-binding oxidoreductase n=1 Tax=Streptomyces cavernicola TaxID=3043613 RepID=A0ABT6S5J8_9ACTN|nr:FAD/NAD(P)-binding oxidoreductase [Streptomyces sp. B-S-A6]MDI3403327.1 FAD/NAD(P)-binding oxidoreductase [Streptomyces sp. B-S-A6]